MYGETKNQITQFCFLSKKNNVQQIRTETRKSSFLFRLFVVTVCIGILFFVVSRMHASSYSFDRREYAKLKRIKWDQAYQDGIRRRCRKEKECFSVSKSLGYIVHDIGLLHYNLFSWDSVKVAVTAFPFYISARMIDERLQEHFFDHEIKKNVNKPPEWCKKVSRYGIGIPIAFLGSRAFFSRDEEQQLTAQVMLMGMPFVLLTKDLIKKLRFDINLRPYHERFSPDYRCSGGFPSGHLAEISYLATLYGLRYGPQYAVPLSALGVFVGTTFLACNRHYVSQMFAGTAFGVMYALAADRVINHRLCQHRDVNLGFCMSEDKGAQLSFNMSF